MASTDAIKSDAAPADPPRMVVPLVMLSLSLRTFGVVTPTDGSTPGTLWLVPDEGVWAIEPGPGGGCEIVNIDDRTHIPWIEGRPIGAVLLGPGERLAWDGAARGATLRCALHPGGHAGGHSGGHPGGDSVVDRGHHRPVVLVVPDESGRFDTVRLAPGRWRAVCPGAPVRLTLLGGGDPEGQVGPPDQERAIVVVPD